MSDSKIANTGFILNVLSLIMLIGIGGSVENMPPDASGAAWLFVLLETAAKPATSVDALKLVADLELVIQTHVMRDLPPAEKKAFMIAKWSVPVSVPAVRCRC